MKIIMIMGGLGNQIFGFAYYQMLRNKFPNEKIYGFYPKTGLKLHNGLEIDRHFKIALPKATAFSNIIAYPLFYTNKILERLGLPTMCMSTDVSPSDKKLLHFGYWQNKRYIPKGFYIDFNLENISLRNLELVKEIRDCNSVALHIRRGDYLNNPKDFATFGNICTDYYYKKAMEYINTHISNPQFYIFSDDPEYVKSTYNGSNMHIIDWNKGEDSFFDMYLMSKTKYMILANSTFSYWAAMLNKNKELVLCPTKWNNNSIPPDIIQQEWIIIPSKP